MKNVYTMRYSTYMYNPSIALPACLTLWTHRNTNGELSSCSYRV